MLEGVEIWHCNQQATEPKLFLQGQVQGMLTIINRHTRSTSGDDNYYKQKN